MLEKVAHLTDICCEGSVNRQGHRNAYATSEATHGRI
jgi:hypothetical protein